MHSIYHIIFINFLWIFFHFFYKKKFRSRYVRLWMKMDAIKVDANSTNNMLREWSFSEKQMCKANRLFHGISDLDPSENLKNDRNTNHIDEKEQYIYTRPIEDDEDDEEEEDDDGTGKKRILIIALGVVCCIAILALIGFGIFWYFKFWKDSSTSKLSPVEKVQKKCKEYTDLACSLQSSGNKGPIQIVRGDRVPRGMLPHQAYLRFKLIGDQQDAMCGGSLINERFILTAAHCLQNASFTSMNVLLGSLNTKNSNFTLWKKIKKFHVHPNFTTTSISDIGLLELVEKVKFNSDVRPICLNTKLEEHYDLVITSGWGRTESGGPSDYLRMVELRIDGKEVVENCRFHTNNYPSELKELANKTLICAAHLTQGIDHGDSGGPLQVKLKSSCENTWEQIGVTSSSGNIEGEENYNSIFPTWQFFVKVEYYIPWIASLVWPD